jgi:hypothetical protein
MICEYIITGEGRTAVSIRRFFFPFVGRTLTVNLFKLSICVSFVFH